MNSKKSNKVFNKDYLTLNIISYLNAKDLSNISAVNIKFYNYSNKFNSYWQNACMDYFCSNLDEKK